jgi:hypothetical protein
MQEYFWSIAIEEGLIQAAIWTIQDSAASVTSMSEPASFTDDESLVVSADTCLSTCIQKLPADVVEPTRSVFAVPSFWVNEGQIDRQYLDKIRLICNKLSLTPTGFVVMPEAIAHFMKSQEKTPISALLIGTYGQKLDISLYRFGNLVGNVNVSRSANITDDVTEGLARFGVQEPFPSRFILYGSKNEDLEDLKQSLIKADWDLVHEQVKFLHAPQVEIFSDTSKMSAVTLAGALEIGQISSIVLEAKEPSAPSNQIPAEMDNIEGVVDAASLGFTTTFDSSSMNRTESAAENTYEAPGTYAAPKNQFNVPFMRKLGINLNENILFIGAILLLLLIVGGFAAFWFVPTAQVTVILSARKIEKKEQVKFDTAANSVDTNALKIPAKTVTSTQTGDKTKTATGTTTIGTRAKGSVTFYNVGGSTTIPSGTELDASNLAFSLDSDVQVASASGAASAATAKGNITAGAVGADSNLAGGTFFTVGNFSSSLIQAKNDADLSGGSSQEVTAVSKDDLDSLTKDLTTQLSDAGKNSLKSNLTPGYLFIDSSLTSAASSQKFDHDAGEQASTVKGTLSVKVAGQTVARSDLEELAKKIFASEVPNGYTLSSDSIDFVFEPNDVDFKINLLPNLNKDDIANKISGKTLSAAKETLSKLPGFEDIEVTMKPNLPFLQMLPHVANNIKITVSGK